MIIDNPSRDTVPTDTIWFFEAMSIGVVYIIEHYQNKSDVYRLVKFSINVENRADDFRWPNKNFCSLQQVFDSIVEDYNKANKRYKLFYIDDGRWIAVDKKKKGIVYFSDTGKTSLLARNTGSLYDVLKRLDGEDYKNQRFVCPI